MSDAQPTVLIWDPIRDLDWSYDAERDVLDAAGVQLVVPDTDQATEAQLAAADVIIVSGKFPNELFAHLSRCVGIICYSVGMDAVDAAAAERAAIPVTNVAGYCTDEVCDHAMTLLLGMQRRLVSFARRADEGDWDVYSGADFYGIRRMRGQTVGIVGLGRIGSQVAIRCEAFGMTVRAYDPFLSSSPLPFVELVELDDLLRDSDVVILCSALTSSARRLLDAEHIGLMRPGAFLVNVARGGIVDETALATALRRGQLAGAALDVREIEPPDAESDVLRGLPNILLTQHVAATSQEARDDLHAFAAQRALELLSSSGRVAMTR